MLFAIKNFLQLEYEPHVHLPQFKVRSIVGVNCVGLSYVCHGVEFKIPNYYNDAIDFTWCSCSLDKL